MSKLPDAIRKRNILWDRKRSSDSDRAAQGKHFLEAGRIFEACDFYSASKNLPGLTEIKNKAIESGDAFLLGRVNSLNLIEITQDEWSTAAKNAESVGKFHFAIRCFEEAEDHPAAARLREKIGLTQPAPQEPSKATTEAASE